jgi:hypothetical protein
VVSVTATVYRGPPLAQGAAWEWTREDRSMVSLRDSMLGVRTVQTELSPDGSSVRLLFTERPEAGAPSELRVVELSRADAGACP